MSELESMVIEGDANPDCLIVSAGVTMALPVEPVTKNQRKLQREHYPLMIFATAGQHNGGHCQDVQLLDGQVAQVIYAQIGVLLEQLPVGPRDQAQARVAQLQAEFREHLARDPRSGQ